MITKNLFLEDEHNMEMGVLKNQYATLSNVDYLYPAGEFVKNFRLRDR